MAKDGLGQKAASVGVPTMSALPSNADIRGVKSNVWEGPLSDSCSAAKGRLFDHLVRTAEDRNRHADAQRLGSLEIDHQLKLGQLHDWQISRFFPFENSASEMFRHL